MEENSENSENIPPVDPFANFAAISQLNDIISMEQDDDWEMNKIFEKEISIDKSEGPFSSMEKVLQHNAHLSIFINYLISNNTNSNSMLFYLITNVPLIEARSKDVRRWVYEIHSTFTCQESPLLIPGVDENISKEIDQIIANLNDEDKYDKDILERVFFKARIKAELENAANLKEFFDKRLAGLLTMYGPPDVELVQTIHDREKEQETIELYLLPRFESFIDDWSDYGGELPLAMINALGTVLSRFFLPQLFKSNEKWKILDKCSLFLTKNNVKEFQKLSSVKRGSKTDTHKFRPHTFKSIAFCRHCEKLLWGISPQGFQCNECKINLHKRCIPKLNDNKTCLEIKYLYISLVNDSDIEMESVLPEWTENVPPEIIEAMEKMEQKRQDVLNEFFHTERTHVRNLKIIDRMFYRPLLQQKIVSDEILEKIFSNLEQVLENHQNFNNDLKKIKREGLLIGEIGSTVLKMFENEKFLEVATEFCMKQKISDDTLREQCKKNHKFNNFILEMEANPICRRLCLRDLLPMGWNRLTKYPLLFESLAKYIPDHTTEYENIQKVVQLSKNILSCANVAIRESEKTNRLAEIQSKLEKPYQYKEISEKYEGYDANHFIIKIINKLRVLDITRHNLLYETSVKLMLQSKYNKYEGINIQMILLENQLVLLLKQDEKFVLKIFSNNLSGSSEKLIMPIIPLSNDLILRQVAADKKAFIIMNTTTANMYEFVCSTMEEGESWFQNITDAIEKYKKETRPGLKSQESIMEEDSYREKEILNKKMSANISQSVIFEVEESSENETEAETEAETDPNDIISTCIEKMCIFEEILDSMPQLDFEIQIRLEHLRIQKSLRKIQKLMNTSQANSYENDNEIENNRETETRYETMLFETGNVGNFNQNPDSNFAIFHDAEEYFV